jgi:hypothetical protein
LEEIFAQRLYFMPQVNYFAAGSYWKTPVLRPLSGSVLQGEK